MPLKPALFRHLHRQPGGARPARPAPWNLGAWFSPSRAAPSGAWADRRFFLQPHPDGSTGLPPEDGALLACEGDGAQRPATPDPRLGGRAWAAGQPEPIRPDGGRRLVVFLYAEREPRAERLRETLPASVRLRDLQPTCSLREAFRAEFDLSPAWRGELSLLLDSITSTLSPRARVLSAWLSLEPGGGWPAPHDPPPR